MVWYVQLGFNSGDAKVLLLSLKLEKNPVHGLMIQWLDYLSILKYLNGKRGGYITLHAEAEEVLTDEKIEF